MNSFLNREAILVETPDGGFQEREIGPLVGIFDPASLHHLNDLIIYQIVVHCRPKDDWLVAAAPVPHMPDDFCIIDIA